MIPKILAFYLPQFHEVKENSEWYGEGFTDWVTVQNARPLFEGHHQPRIPFEHNYYDLSKIETMKWQAETARKYGVDGFCFYHYWFDSNTRLLEKPAELLLKHKEIDISYCFSWANESWKRTWSNVKTGNVWCNINDNVISRRNFKDRGLLAKQRYGREEEWQRHIKYLIPFFQDDRYVKINGRPVLCVYQPCDIICIRAMLEVWNDLLKREGFDGIYFIGASYGKLYSNVMDMNYDHEPGTAFARCREANEYDKTQEGTEFFNYDVLWNHILRNIEHGKVSCAFTDFDASPRKGYKGVIVKGAAPEKFRRYFTEFLIKNMHAANEIVFVNAWNEWGEGMYLEPCEDNQYEYLNAIHSAVLCAEKEGHASGSLPENAECRMPRSPAIGNSVLQVAVLEQWLSAYRLGFRAGDFFNKYGYSTIAIYGMGILGKQLKEELEECNMQIAYYIDRTEIPGMESARKVSLSERLPEADCIVITVLAEFDAVYDVLKQKTNAALVSIGEIFEDLV